MTLRVAKRKTPELPHAKRGAILVVTRAQLDWQNRTNSHARSLHSAEEDVYAP